MYLIAKNKQSWLSVDPSSEWCIGVTGFSKNRWMQFKTIDEANNYIEYLIQSLNDWINIDVQKSSLDWSNDPNVPIYNRRSTYLQQCQERYTKNMKIIKSLKVYKVNEGNSYPL